jgi:hypothetical protein
VDNYLEAIEPQSKSRKRLSAKARKTVNESTAKRQQRHELSHSVRDSTKLELPSAKARIQ